jgi:hypothetical protein
VKHLIHFGLLLAIIAVAVHMYRLEKRVDGLHTRVESLETDTLYLNMQIGTTKLLLKETQRMVVPREVALKRQIPAKR